MIFILKNIKIFFLLINLILISSCSSYKAIKAKDVKGDLLTSGDVYGKFIWSRKDDNTIMIHEKNLKKICRKSKASSNLYFRSLVSYSADLVSKRREVAKSLTFSEKTYVTSYVVDYLYRCLATFKEDDTGKNMEYVYRLLSPKIKNKYNVELKKNDYYGLKLLKEEHLKKFRPYHELSPSHEEIKRVID